MFTKLRPGTSRLIEASDICIDARSGCHLRGLLLRDDVSPSRAVGRVRRNWRGELSVHLNPNPGRWVKGLANDKSKPVKTLTVGGTLQQRSGETAVMPSKFVEDRRVNRSRNATDEWERILWVVRRLPSHEDNPVLEEFVNAFPNTPASHQALLRLADNAMTGAGWCCIMINDGVDTIEAQEDDLNRWIGEARMFAKRATSYVSRIELTGSPEVRAKADAIRKNAAHIDGLKVRGNGYYLVVD